MNRRKAAFPVDKRLVEFDYRHQTTITKRQVSHNVINSTLSYFRLPPEASSQGVLSSSVSFMNDAGNTIWRWLRSW